MKRPRQGAPGPKVVTRTVRPLRLLHGGYQKVACERVDVPAYAWERPLICSGCGRSGGTLIRIADGVYSHKATGCIAKAVGKAVPA